MAKISSYPIISVPTLNDLLIGTDVENLNETKNFTIGDIGTLIGQDYVPYVGATGNVNLGSFNITGSGFIVGGGTSSQFLKADGSLDSTVYTPQTRTLTINGTTYNLSANRSWDLNTIDSLTTIGTSGAATYVGKTLNIPVYQAQGSYITQLSGEATGSGPGNASVTLDNTAVISKVLSGLNVTGGTILSTDTILQAFGKVQNQINGLAGGVEYQGVWNASTNTPTLQSSVGTQGYYYVVDVAGTTNLNGITDWQVGDWAIYNGTVWQKVDNTDAVVSVNGYVGAVVLTASDVGAVPTTRTLTINGVGYNLSADRAWTVGDVRTDGSYANPSWITSLAWSKITSTPTTLAGYGITDGALNTTTLTINGVTYDLTSNRSWSVGTVTSVGTSGPLTGGTITGSGTIGITQAGASSDGYLSSADWNAFNSKQAAISVNAPLTFVAGVVGITQAGASTDGYLSSTDWNTFNSKVGGSGTANTLPMWGSSSSLVNSPLSYSLDTFNFQYNSSTGGTVNFTNIGLTTYTYSIQMNNFGSPRSTIHSYTDGLIIQSIGGTQVSRMFANGNLILGAGTVDNGYKLEITGNLYVNTIANATTDTDRFIVSDGGVIKYRTGAQVLSDIGAQGALTLTTVGSSGVATLIGNTLNIPNYSSSLTGYVPYNGATQNVDLGEFGISAGYFQADLTPTQAAGVGRLIWNNTDGTLNLGLLGGIVNLHIGQQQYARVVNGTGANRLRANYQAVKIIGAQGQRMQVGLSRADNDANSKDTLGLIAENINNNNEGFIISSGLIEEINTTGSLQGETWLDGDTLYLSGTTFGALTNVKPIAPVHTVIIGFVVYAHANHGKIFVKVDNGYELEELHDVNPLPYVNNGVLYRDTATNLWKSATIPTLLGYTPANAATTLTINGTTFDLSANRTWSVGTVTSVAALTLGTSGTDLSSTVANGTTTPVITLNVPTASATNRGALSAADWSTFNSKQNAITLTTTGTSGAATLVGSTLNIPIYSPDLSGYVPTSRTITINGVTQDLSANRTFNVGTVTSVGLSSATSGVTIGSTPVTSSGTITLAIATATATQNGLLSSTDWSTFNSKQNTITLTTTGTSGAATLVGSTLNIPQYQAAGTYVGSVTASSPLASSGGTTPNITIQQASGSQSGFLSSTDWTTFNNKQNALTNPVTGTGTTNYLPKFTGSTTIGNSVLQETSGNIQLDNTSSVYIANSSSSSYFGGLSIRQSGTERARFAANSDLGSYIYSPTFNGFSILSDATTFLRLTSSGNLGLGVTPSAWDSNFRALQVRNVSLANFNSNSTLALLNNGYFNTDWRYITNASVAMYVQSSNAEHIWYNAPSGTAGNAISFTQAMTLNASGNLLVGTTTDAGHKLRVYSSGSTRIQIDGAGNNSGVLLSESGTNQWSVASVGSSLLFYNEPNASTRMTLNSSGNLGLGVTPSAWNSSVKVIEIANTGNFIGNSGQDNWLATNTIYDSGATFRYARTGSAVAFYSQSSGGHFWFNAPIGTAGNSISLNPAMTLTSGGYLVLGNTSSVYGQAGRGTFEMNGSADNILAMRIGGSLAGYVYTYASAMELYSTNAMQFSTAGAIRATITTSGNLLVGTTSDNGQRVQISGGLFVNNGGNEGIFISNGSTNSSLQQFDNALYLNSNSNSATAGSFIFRSSNSFTTRMVINSSGNVGIGTSSPNAITVIATTLASSASFNWLTFRNLSVGYGTWGFVKQGLNGLSLNYGTDSDTPNVGSAITFAYGGNVLIGTTTDNGARLQVSGAATFSSTISATQGIFQSTQGSILLRSNGTASPYIDFYTSVSSVAATMYGLDGGGFVIGVPATERFRITSGGNVGIGTSSPERRLHVTNSMMLSTAGGAQEFLIGDGNVRYFSLQTPVGAANMQFNVYGGANIMTLTSSGNVGIGTGTSTLFTRFTVQTTNSRFEYDDISSTTSYLEVLNSTRTASNEFSIYSRAVNLFTRPVGSNYTQSMTLTSGGNVLIGTTTDVGARLYVNGTIRTGQLSGPLPNSVTWLMGNARGGAATNNALIRVEINGVLVDLLGNYV